VEEEMTQIPQTDSISVVARFWDSHDVTDFVDELEEVSEPIFARREKPSLKLSLGDSELARVRELASSQGVDEEALIARWVREKLSQTQG
jgi:hypothetical protein